MKEREGLEHYHPDRKELVEGGGLKLCLNLPLHSVCMFVLTKV